MHAKVCVVEYQHAQACITKCVHSSHQFHEIAFVLESRLVVLLAFDSRLFFCVVVHSNCKCLELVCAMCFVGHTANHPNKAMALDGSQLLSPFRYDFVSFNSVLHQLGQTFYNTEIA